MSGKGSGRRPRAIDPETEAANWQRTFGRHRMRVGPTIHLTPKEAFGDAWTEADHARLTGEAHMGRVTEINHNTITVTFDAHPNVDKTDGV